MTDLSPLVPHENQQQSWMSRRDGKPIALPFEEAAERVIAAGTDDGERRDVIINRADSWAFGTGDGEHMALQRVPLPGREHSEANPLRKLAFQQMCSRLGIPSDYIETLPKQLQVGCVNWSLKNAGGSEYKARLAGEQIRAIMSPKYAAYDDPLLVEVAHEALDQAGIIGDARVRSLGTGMQTVMRITIPNEGVELRSGDVIEWGLDIGNSEVGLRSVQVTPITYRLVCTNGLRSWQSDATMKMRHVGDEQTLRDRVRDAVPIALAEGSGHLDLWRRSVDRMVEGVLDHIEGLEGFGLQKNEIQKVGRALADDHGLPQDQSVYSLADHLGQASVYEITNAITSAARERPIERRLAMEESAHRYLTRYAA